MSRDRARWVLGIAAALAAVASPRLGQACSCGVTGPDSALTSRNELYGTAVTERLELGHGRFDAHGAYRSFDASERWTSFDLSALAALRPHERVELAASSGYLRGTSSSGDARDTASGVKDSTLTLRWELLDQAMRWSDAGSPLELALVCGVLVPTARLGGAEERGLGAFELSAGAAVFRYFSPSTRAGFTLDAATRFPERSLGVERELGPRLTPQLSLSHWLLPSLVLSGFSSLRWEGDVTLEGETRPGTGSRAWQVGAAAAFRAPGSPIRSTLAVRHVPAVSGIGVNTIASSSLELGLAVTD